MCTVLRFGGFFGRNLDLDGSYGEQVCVLPRGFPLDFRRLGRLDRHFALVGMALAEDGYPLFYDAANEKGLAMAGLNFPGNARYFPAAEGRDNVAPFELIPWVLGQCASLGEARRLLERGNVMDIPFRDGWPATPLHWMVADSTGSLAVESTADGLHIYEDRAEVLTNNPPFPYQLFNLNNYRHLSPDTPEERFGMELEVYCQGMGGLGLPGDGSSMSRFVRAAFGVKNALEAGGISQVFHLLDSVKMLRGLCRTDGGQWDYTVYSGCMDLEKGRYYYVTDGNRQLNRVDLFREDLDGCEMRLFSLETEQMIRLQN